MVVTGKSLLQHHPWKPCRNKNGPTLGKLDCDIKGPSLRPKHPALAPNLVTTQNFYHDVRIKISVVTQPARHAWEPYRDTEILVATRRSLSRHRDPCRDTKIPVMTRRSMSRHGDPCHDMKIPVAIRRSLSRHRDPCCNLGLESSIVCAPRPCIVTT